MPYRLSDILTREPNYDLHDVFESDLPIRVAGIATVVVVSVVAAATYVHTVAHIDRPWLLALLLLVAIVPCVVQCFVDLDIAVVEVAVLGSLGLLNLAGQPLGIRDPGGREQMSILILVWLAGEVASIGLRRHVITVTAGIAAIVFGRVLVDRPYGEAVFVWAAAVGLALLAGLFIRTLVLALVNTKVADAALRDQAITEERQRIAREVHDVIAHSMTVTMLHLTAARMAVVRGDSAAATEALEEAEKAGRTSLNEIRHTVGLLRTDATQPAIAPLPSATDVPTLVAGYQGAGVDVTLDVRGELAAVEPAAGLALYRIVQESLTNAGRHTPGARTVVRIDVGPPLQVDVASEGGTATSERGSGLGLAGMAERTAALGGRLEAGQHGTGWRVAATIP